MTVVLPPAATVNGAAGDEENSALVPAQGATALTASGAVPSLRTCVVSDAEPPTVTVPNESVVGASAIAGAGTATPAPESETATDGLAGSLLVNASDPVSAVRSAGA